MFNREETAQKFNVIVADKLNIDKASIKSSATLQELGADSLDLVEIIMKLEESFGIEIPDDDIVNLHTVQEYTDYVQQKRTK